MTDLFCDKMQIIQFNYYVTCNLYFSLKYPIKAAVQAHEQQHMDRRQNLNQRRLFDDKAMNIEMTQ